MSVHNQGPVRRKTERFRQFLVAGTRHDLYDSRKASERVPIHVLIAEVRAIVLVALAGGAIWYLLWKLASSVVGRH